MILGPCKILLSIVLATILWPTRCGDFVSIHPLAAFLIGAWWIRDGLVLAGLNDGKSNEYAVIDAEGNGDEIAQLELGKSKVLTDDNQSPPLTRSLPAMLDDKAYGRLQQKKGDTAIVR